jgi:hypothetical protein
VRFSMKHTEIEYQECYDEAGESRVEPPVVKERKQMSGHLLALSQRMGNLFAVFLLQCWRSGSSALRSVEL